MENINNQLFTALKDGMGVTVEASFLCVKPDRHVAGGARERNNRLITSLDGHKTHCVLLGFDPGPTKELLTMLHPELGAALAPILELVAQRPGISFANVRVHFMGEHTIMSLFWLRAGSHEHSQSISDLESVRLTSFADLEAYTTASLNKHWK